MENEHEKKVPVCADAGWKPEDGEQELSQDPTVDLSFGPVVEGEDND
jgi:hypothetical protein